MGSMRQAAGDHPRSGALHIEELRWFFPPALILLLEYSESLAAMFRIAFHEPGAGFLFRKRRRTDIDALDVDHARMSVLRCAGRHKPRTPSEVGVLRENLQPSVVFVFPERADISECWFLHRSTLRAC